MDCTLCSSISSRQGQVDSLESDKHNCLNDLGELTSRKFAHSLCQLLDLPTQQFQDKLLQPDISFCSSCVQSLSTIWILLDQLEQLQKQISEVRGLVTNQILDAVRNDNEESSFHPVHILRIEMSRVIKSQEQNSGVDHSILYGRLIEDTTVKEEIEAEECDVLGEPEPNWFPIHCDSNDDDASIIGEEDDDDAVTTHFSVMPMPVDELIQEIRDSKRVLRVSLTRLEDAVQGNEGQECAVAEIKAKLKPKPKPRSRLRKMKPKTINMKTSTHTSTLWKSMAEINEREEFFKQKYEDGNVMNSEVGSPSPPPIQKKKRGRIPIVNKTISCTFPECSQKFKTRKGRQHHIRSAHSHSAVSALQCPICSKTFKRKYSMDGHVKSHSGEKPCICEFCGKGFCTQVLLKTHRTRHTAERRISCPHCPMRFVANSDLKHHILVHTGERNFMCEMCSKSFKRKIELTNHQAQFHANELNLEEFKCKFCSKTLSSSTSLKIHEMIHTGEFKIACNLCSFRCDRPSRLKVHMKSHGDERNLMCTECGKTYKHKAQLDVHVRTHTNERPFKCPDCPSDFRDKTHLRRHIAVLHSGLTPFKCTLCGDGFPLRKYLNRHMEKHRSGKISTPQQSQCVEESQD